MDPYLFHYPVSEGSPAVMGLSFWLPVCLPISSPHPYTSLYPFLPRNSLLTALVCIPFIRIYPLPEDCLQWDHLESFTLLRSLNFVCWGILDLGSLIAMCAHPCALWACTDVLRLASSTLCCWTPLHIHICMEWRVCSWYSVNNEWMRLGYSYFYQRQSVPLNFPCLRFSPSLP